MKNDENEYVSPFQAWSQAQDQEDEKAAFRDPAGRGDPINNRRDHEDEDEKYLQGMTPQGWFYAHCNGGQDFRIRKWKDKQSKNKGTDEQ